jgi:hypothetical protein
MPDAEYESSCAWCGFPVEGETDDALRATAREHIWNCEKNPMKQIRHAANALAGYAATCNMKNSLEWMEGMAKALNDYLEAVGDSDRVATFGHGLGKITAEEYSLYDSHGFPKQ